MPSIEPCETASGSVAALPSTLEIFDKFKSVSENGKDSDSEESFHLPLDDDDMESQSGVSNGRDKEIHNEETEDDILNKFEVVPSGTPDHIDPHIEDSILDDVDNAGAKGGDNKVAKKKVIVNSETKVSEKPLNGDVEEDEQPTEELEDKDADEKDKKQTKVQVEITCDFGEYEDSADGEFKSVYETDEPPKETVDKETVDKETKIEEDATLAVEPTEPMEVSDEPETIECDDLDSTDASPRKVEEVVDNFEDSMEVEQEDTNQDIANIIEKLEDQDTPMQDVTSVDQKNEGDANVIVSDDVEMTADSQINVKENVDQKDCDEFTNVTKTFQESTEASKDKSEETVGKTEVQVSVNNEEVNSELEKASDSEKKDEEEANPIDIEERHDSEKIENPIEDKDITESESSDEPSKDKLEDVTDSKSKNEEAETPDSVESPKAVEMDDLSEEKQTKTNKDDLQDDDLLKELEQTINASDDNTLKESEPDEKQSDQSDEPANNTSKESEAEEKQSEESAINTPKVSEPDEKQADQSDESADNTSKESADEKQSNHSDESAIEDSKESEIDEKQLKLSSNKDEEVFKAPVEVPKEHPSSQNEDLDSQNDKSNDKTDEEELDLLDVSMVRETDEDDACAIADALNDKDIQGSEKSDEEQSEKVETEQESSDVDKDNDDNDAIDFDDLDDDSHMESVDQDDSSNAGSARGKIIQISESSKDGDSEGEPKRSKKAADVDSDASNDVTDVDASDETENMDVSGSIIPNKSVNLNSTLAEDDSEKEPSVTPVPIGTEAESEKEAELKKDKTSDNDKTENDSEKSKESSESRVKDKKESVAALPEESKSEDMPERRKISLNKRSLSSSNLAEDEIFAKKPKLAPTCATDAEAQKENVEKSAVPSKEPAEKEPIKDTAVANDKIKTLTEFSKFMQCRKFTAKLSRSDLEQFCIQKICESLMLRSSEGELHQTIKKHEKTIEFLRKDLLQLTKQCKDLEIVNKKLMNELRSQNSLKKPLVPLKITRSVGLQVRLNPGNEAANQSRRRLPAAATPPQKQMVSNSPGVRAKTATATNTQQPSVVRQVLQSSPQKSPLTTGQTTTTTTTKTTTNTATPANQLLSQALQQTKARPAQVVAAKRTATPVRKQPETPKPTNAGSGNPGVIDLTDEDDRLAASKTVVVPKAVTTSTAVTKAVGGSTIKIMNKTASPATTQNKNIGKMVPGKTVSNQGKQIQKTVQVGTNKGNLSQGIRLTNASVITSSANGSPQMVYVVPTITSNSGGTQKVAFVNFQPTNGVISGTLNGSPVSVMSNKGQTLTLKTVPSIMRQKHPAPLPPPPRTNIDPKLKPLLPKPHLTIKKIDTGIILQWKMPYNLDQYESIASYQLYAYQETSAPPNTDMWRKVGDVKALALPMACTLTQFADKNKYYFAVRSVDVHKRIGAFSEPEEISL